MKCQPRKKLTKLTNSLRDGEIWKQTSKETHKTHKTHPLTDLKETHKTHLKKKLTKNQARPHSRIGRISNNIRYSFSLCEFVSFTEVQCREEIKNREYIQYISRRGKTHKTHKLPSPYRGDHRGIALLAMSLHPGLSLRPPSPAEQPRPSCPSPHLGRCTRDNVPRGAQS